MAIDLRIMKHRATFKNVTKTDDGGGGRTEAVTDVFKRHVGIKSADPEERIVAGHEERKVTHILTMRFSKKVTAKTLVFIGTREFLLIGAPVDRDGMQQKLELRCEEKVG